MKFYLFSTRKSRFPSAASLFVKQRNGLRIGKSAGIQNGPRIIKQDGVHPHVDDRIPKQVRVPQTEGFVDIGNEPVVTDPFLSRRCTDQIRGARSVLRCFFRTVRQNREPQPLGHFFQDQFTVRQIIRPEYGRVQLRHQAEDLVVKIRIE